ncbi:hypothetical protein M1N91_02875, partial [Dehalococcoidia bacterium]|nr:hypothetical protein [Dehalococcoidia bacterium]
VNCTTLQEPVQYPHSLSCDADWQVHCQPAFTRPTNLVTWWSLYVTSPRLPSRETHVARLILVK